MGSEISSILAKYSRNILSQKSLFSTQSSLKHRQNGTSSKNSSSK